MMDKLEASPTETEQFQLIYPEDIPRHIKIKIEAERLQRAIEMEELKKKRDVMICRVKEEVSREKERLLELIKEKAD